MIWVNLGAALDLADDEPLEQRAIAALIGRGNPGRRGGLAFSPLS